MEIHYSMWDDNDRRMLLRSTIVCCLNGDCSGIEKSFDKVVVDVDNRKKNR